VKFTTHQQEDALFKQLQNVLRSFKTIYNETVENSRKLKAICDRKQIYRETQRMNRQVEEIIEEVHASLAGVSGNGGETDVIGADGDVAMDVATDAAVGEAWKVVTPGPTYL
jgi:hypothetical protein